MWSGKTGNWVRGFEVQEVRRGRPLLQVCMDGAPTVTSHAPASSQGNIPEREPSGPYQNCRSYRKWRYLSADSYYLPSTFSTCVGRPALSDNPSVCRVCRLCLMASEC